MRWVFAVLLAFQVPVGGSTSTAPGKAGADQPSADAALRSAIERMNAGVDAHANGDDSDALARIDEALVLAPGYVPALINRGRILAGQARYADALAAFEAGLAKADAGQIAELQRDLARLHLAKAATPGLSFADQRAELGLAAEAAKISLRQADDYRGQHLLGRALDGLDQATGADLAYRTCLDQHALYVPCWVDLAQLTADYGHVNVAMAIAETATKVDDTDPALWLSLAKVAATGGYYDAAAESAAKASTLDPDGLDAYYVGGMAQVELQQRTRAIESLTQFEKRAPSSDPRLAQVRQTLGLLQAPP